MTRGYVEFEIPGTCMSCPVGSIKFFASICTITGKDIPRWQPKPDWCPIKEHDLGVCAEKHKEEMEELHRQATERLGW